MANVHEPRTDDPDRPDIQHVSTHRILALAGLLILLLATALILRAFAGMPPENFPAPLLPAVQEIAKASLVGQDLTARDKTGKATFSGRTYQIGFSTELPATADVREVAWLNATRIERLPESLPGTVENVEVDPEQPEPSCIGQSGSIQSCYFEADVTLATGDQLTLELTVVQPNAADPVSESLTVILVSDPPDAQPQQPSSP